MAAGGWLQVIGLAVVIAAKSIGASVWLLAAVSSWGMAAGSWMQDIVLAAEADMSTDASDLLLVAVSSQ